MLMGLVSSSSDLLVARAPLVGINQIPASRQAFQVAHSEFYAIGQAFQVAHSEFYAIVAAVEVSDTKSHFKLQLWAGLRKRRGSNRLIIIECKPMELLTTWEDF
eukprot:5642217-Amphidinium_carterae.1